MGAAPKSTSNSMAEKALDWLFPYATGAGQERDERERVAQEAAPKVSAETAFGQRIVGPDGRAMTAAEAAGSFAPEAGSPGSVAPDLTDESLRKVRRAQALGLLTKRGRRSTFLTGMGGGYTSGGPGAAAGLGIGARPTTSMRNTYLGGR